MRRRRVADATTTLETVESFGIGYSQGAGASTGDWMKPPGDLFLYCDMKDLGADMVSLFACVYMLLREIHVVVVVINA